MTRSDSELRSIRDSVALVGRLSDSIVRFGPFSLGVDGVLSWIPGVGEIYSTLAGGFIVLQGARAGVPLPTLAAAVALLSVRTIASGVPLPTLAAAVALLSVRTIASGVPLAGAVFSDVFTAHRWAAAMIVKAIDQQLGVGASDRPRWSGSAVTA